MISEIKTLNANRVPISTVLVQYYFFIRRITFRKSMVPGTKSLSLLHQDRIVEPVAGAGTYFHNKL